MEHVNYNHKHTKLRNEKQTKNKKNNRKHTNSTSYDEVFKNSKFDWLNITIEILSLVTIDCFVFIDSANRIN